jgi:ATP-dependent helicase/nuclease subunit B
MVDGELVAGLSRRDPLQLANVTLFLPTKRACRMARQAFLDELGTDAAILPRIVPLGSIDEDEFAFDESASAADALDLPSAIGGLERQMLLAKLVLQWAQSPGVRAAGGAPLVAHSPGAAFALADDLARLIDDMTTRKVPWDELDHPVPSDLDQYWLASLEFLKIARDKWPDILKERGTIERSERRDRLIEAEGNRLASLPDSPVIAAGSTGSMPATAKLIAKIATLPRGAVVLPGLDTSLDDASWRAIGEASGAPSGVGHPQFAIHALLTRMEIGRGDVVTLGASQSPGRELLLSEALRPAESTDLWPARLADRAIAEQIKAGLAGLTLIEAANAEEESLAVAVALREAVEDNKTAALVTPDRRLARRVAAALGRWQIAVEDTGGEPLDSTAAGIFARLAAEVGLGGLAPVPLLALLKHPLLRLDCEPLALNRGIAALELAILRGPRPRAGSAALAHALHTTQAEWAKSKSGGASSLHPTDWRMKLSADDFDAVADLVARLTPALAPLESVTTTTIPFKVLAERHREVIVRLSAANAAATAFQGVDGTALADFFDELASQPDDSDVVIARENYADLFHAAIKDHVVHRDYVADARVRIYGLLEARLMHCDRAVLGGLVEGTWPPETSTDPWLNRPMRQALGLNLPELRIGLTAHDFAQLAGAREVILSRATKLGGAPTVASRFVQRLAAVAGAQWQSAIARGEQYLAWAREIDRPIEGKKIKPPAPTPPREARPTSLSVTEIENWLRDPYTIYARHILRLRPIDPIDMLPGAAERGSVIHGAIGEFTQRFAKELPADPLAELTKIGRKWFAPLQDFPEAQAFWWPRFERIARWFVDWEKARRANTARVQAETSGKTEFSIGERNFVLRGRADRIEQSADGTYAILDYKTGRVPGHKEVQAGLAPQLTLEAAILRAGGFAGIEAGATVGQLVYIALRGGEDGGEQKPVKFDASTPDAEAERALAELKKLATRFEDGAQPYRSLVSSMWKTRYGDYDHLARVKEWSLAGAGDDGGGE